MGQNDDLISGWRYLATLQLRTPLSYLERDGEFSPGPAEPQLVGPAVNTVLNGDSFNEYGIWLMVIDAGILPPSTLAIRATEFGTIKIGSQEEKDLLSFLKSFRYIIETAETHDQILTELDDLSLSNPENKKIWKRMLLADPKFPHSFFYQKLCGIPGVGVKLAEKLYHTGFRSINNIFIATDKDLLKVEGVGSCLLSKVRIHQKSRTTGN